MQDCKTCERFVEGNCKLREIAPQLRGCDGYGMYSKKLYKEREERLKKAEMTAIKQEEEDTAALGLLKVGDKVELKANPKSMVGCKNLPQYLENGVLTVLGFAKSGKVICDWDGGKPFRIPREALRVVTK